MPKMAILKMLEMTELGHGTSGAQTTSDEATEAPSILPTTTQDSVYDTEEPRDIYKPVRLAEMVFEHGLGPGYKMLYAPS
jgi:hypothetical protein